MPRRVRLPLLALATALAAAQAVDRPWIACTYFYWYSWDYQREWGGWEGGVYHTPLFGYYDSSRLADNLRELHCAAEWGVTHHFMDYWGPGWKGEHGEPREDVLRRATEQLQERGYPVYMSVYQDGEDFDMAEFSRNFDRGRDTFFTLDLLSHSPALPKLNGKPLTLIYGRNGIPKLTATDEGFRAWLQTRYPSLAALNERWGSSFTSWDQVRLSFSGGFPRYESIKYQYQVWADEWRRADLKATEHWGWPGALCSWDIGYQPFRGFGWSDMYRVFTGPHSYGGIFGPPHDQGTERFIQAQVSKAYDSIFFDTWKNFYHDWEIRIPGTVYTPQFHAFDRFWVQALLNKSEALLHLSWNEWWEGSNLEPCLEYGKTYCEKNLLWASVMQQCFPSIHRWNEGAEVAVLLNEWNWYCGGRGQADIYGCIEALRRSGVRFDLLPDDFVTRARLAPFRVVIAPAAGVGLGLNGDGEPILKVLADWVSGDAGRRLILSRVPAGLDVVSRLDLRDWLGLAATSTAPHETKPGADLNVLVDVGVEGDERFLVSGMSGREEWGSLPAGAFGARAGRHTVRWCPGDGSETTFLLPFSPHRDHILRFGGDALRPNDVEIRVGDQVIDTIALKPGYNEYELAIPAAAVGGRLTGEVHLVWRGRIVPREVDPEKWQDDRVTNLAIEYLQLATAGTPKDAPQRYELPAVRVIGEASAPPGLAGRTFEPPFAPSDGLAGGATMTRTGDGLARDMVVSAGKGQVWYCDGLLGTMPEPAYFEAILDWAGARADLKVNGDDILGGSLTAGDTTIVLAYNHAAMEPRRVEVIRSAQSLPVAEVRVLSRDGQAFPAAGAAETAGTGELRLSDTIEAYEAWQVVYAPVRVETPELLIEPGERRRVPLRLTNLTPQPVSGSIGLGYHLPSLTAEPTRFELAAGAAGTVELELEARDDCDWGHKTLVLDLATGDRHAYLWRPLDVLRPAAPQLGPAIVQGGRLRVTVAPDTSPYMPSAPWRAVALELAGKTISLQRAGDLWEGAIETPQPTTAESRRETATVTIERAGGRDRHELTIPVLSVPAGAPRLLGAVAPVFVYNPSDRWLEAHPVPIEAKVPPGAYHLVQADGTPLPASLSVDADGLHGEVTASLAPRSASTWYLMPGEAPAVGDLTVTAAELGSGRGVVTVSNSRCSLTVSEAAGGTITSLLDTATGVDYAARNCGGISYGSWGRFEPAKPALNSVAFLAGVERTEQVSRPGQLSVERSPNEVVVSVVWEDDHVRARQRYRLRAYRPVIEYHAEATFKGDPPAGQDLVVADISLRRHSFGKIYPNFTGIGEGMTGDHPHAGWREVPYVPPVASLLSPPAFPVSLSLITRGAARLSRFRQGFWPSDRPQSGPVNTARIEYVAEGGGEVTLDWLIHPGHQPVAERYRDDVLAPPPAFAVTAPTWGETIAATARPGAWHPDWPHALRLSVGPFEAPTTDPLVVAPADLTARLGEPVDPSSPRVLVDGRLLRTPVELDDGQIAFVLTGSWAQGQTAQVTLWYDSAARGPKPPPAGAMGVGLRLSDPGFERGGEGWVLPQPLVTDKPHSGAACAVLDLPTGTGPVVMQTASMRVQPNARYRLSFWARTTSPKAVVRTNLYRGPEYDFPQVALPVPGDGQWHRLETDLTTGPFPEAIRLLLRLWVLGEPQTVYIDDVELIPLGAPIATIEARVID